MTAVGVPQTNAASRAAASRSAWRGWSSTPKPCSAATRAGSSCGTGQAAGRSSSGRSAESSTGAVIRVLSRATLVEHRHRRAAPSPRLGRIARVDPSREVAAFRALLTAEGAALLARIPPYDGEQALASRGCAAAGRRRRRPRGGRPDPGPAAGPGPGQARRGRRPAVVHARRPRAGDPRRRSPRATPSGSPRAAVAAGGRPVLRHRRRPGAARRRGPVRRRSASTATR